MSNKVALIIGITGQDGAYLAELLLKKGYIVHGIKRCSSLFNTNRIDHLYQDQHVDNAKFILHYGDLTDSTNLIRIIQILFNHESPIRGETFVTRKITRALARIKLNLQDCLYLGNMDSFRDWGHAKDYVEMQWPMLQQDHPEDFVIATGVQYSVREFVNVAAKELGIQITWQGQGVDETGIDQHGKVIVKVDPKYFRPTEVETLLGDPTKARVKLGWTPKTTFQELVT